MDIFNKESEIFPEAFFTYARKNEIEYLAEIHSFMYSERKYPGNEAELKGRTLRAIVYERAPLTIKWIER
jgi:hypothetical protein